MTGFVVLGHILLYITTTYTKESFGAVYPWDNLHNPYIHQSHLPNDIKERIHKKD